MARATVARMTRPYSSNEVLQWRMAALGLMPPAREGTAGPDVANSSTERAHHIADVGHKFLAMQGQDFAAARWALGLRVPGSTEVDVIAAFNSGLLIRSWPMRGTLHVVAAQDIGWMQALTSPRILGTSAQRRRDHLGLDVDLIEKVRGITIAALQGGGYMTRDSLMTRISQSGIEIQTGWSYHLVWFLAQTGTITFGPVAPNGREQYLVLADEWIKNPRNLSGDEALAELVQGFARAHGPATVKDLVWWTGLPQRDLKRGFAASGQHMQKITGAEGQEYWVLADQHVNVTPAESKTGTVHLLPAFDEHLLGYTDRSVQLHRDHATAVVPGKNGVFRPTITVNGRTVGTWRRTAANRQVLTITGFDAAHYQELQAVYKNGELERAVLDFSTFTGSDPMPSIELAAP